MDKRVSFWPIIGRVDTARSVRSPPAVGFCFLICSISRSDDFYHFSGFERADLDNCCDLAGTGSARLFSSDHG